jgi:hypothetical protein
MSNKSTGGLPLLRVSSSGRFHRTVSGSTPVLGSSGVEPSPKRKCQCLFSGFQNYLTRLETARGERLLSLESAVLVAIFDDLMLEQD